MKLRTHASAKARWAELRRRLFRRWFAPRPRLHIDEWADQFRRLSEVNSAEPGKWRSSRVPWVKGIVRTIGHVDVRRVVVQKPAQVAYTEGVLGNTIGFHIDVRPMSIVVLQPSDGDAEDWSKDKLQNMLDATPALSKVAEAKSRNKDNTITSKSYPGGRLKVVGGTSPKGLARTSAPVLAADEVDRLPESAGKEGDPLSIFFKRSTTFAYRKEILGSTPTNAGASRIVAAIEDCELVFDFMVPCPHCNHFQTLQWADESKGYGIRYETINRRRVKPGSVFYECARCHAAIEEHDRNLIVARGEWRTDAGSELFKVLASDPPEVIGFRVGSAFISPFDGCRWELLVQEYLDAQGDSIKLQVFWNTRLGLPWDESLVDIDAEQLEGRQESWPAEVPAGVGVLVAGVDVQADRLEVQVAGYGLGDEFWLISHQRLPGDTEKEEVWSALEAIRTRAFKHESGAELRISFMCVDSGYATTTVYKYVRPRQKTVAATKGMELTVPPLRRKQKPDKYGIKLVTISTSTFKDILFRRLGTTAPGRGFMHFSGADLEYFEQFKAEIPTRVRVGGRVIRKWKQVNERNESIDLNVLCLVALDMVLPKFRDAHIRNRLNRLKKEGALAKKQEAHGAMLHEAEEPVADAAPAKRPKLARPPRKSGWVKNW